MDTSSLIHPKPTDKNGGEQVKEAQRLYKLIMGTDSMTAAVRAHSELKTIVKRIFHDDYSIVFPNKTDNEMRAELMDKLRELHEEALKRPFVISVGNKTTTDPALTR
jgi:hypothetical protein